MNPAENIGVDDTDILEKESETTGDGGSSDNAASQNDAELVDPESEVSESESTIQVLEKELAKSKDQLLRQAAEYQNYRRRTERERVVWTRRAQAAVLEAVLPVLDDFGRSLNAGQSDAVPETGLRAGVQLVYENLQSALAGFGVKPMTVEGEPFDEHLHDAILRVPAPDGVDAGQIVQEVQRGYFHGENVLRHAKVVVATLEEVQ